jgi:hypothetical protein
MILPRRRRPSPRTETGCCWATSPRRFSGILGRGAGGPPVVGRSLYGRRHAAAGRDQSQELSPVRHAPPIRRTAATTRAWILAATRTRMTRIGLRPIRTRGCTRNRRAPRSGGAIWAIC